MEILERIRDFDVRDEVSQAVYKRGTDYYRRRLVRLASVSDRQITLRVRGSELYTVDFYLNRGRLGFNCDCPAYRDWGTCKHIVAADLFVKNSSPTVFANAIPSQEGTTNYADIIAKGRVTFGHTRQQDEDANDGWLLLVSLRQHAWSEFYEPKFYAMSLAGVPRGFTTGRKRTLPSRVQDFLSTKVARDSYLRQLTQQNTPAGCANAPWPLIHQLMLSIRDQRKGYLTGREMENFASSQIPMFIGDDDNPLETPLFWDQENHELTLFIEKTGSGVQFTPSLKNQPLSQGDGWGSGKIFDPNRHWILLADQVVRCHRHMSAEQLAALDEVARVHFEAEDETVFFDEYFDSLMPHISLLGDGLHVVEVDPVDPILQFSIIEEFDEETGEASIYLRAGFGYGSYAIDWSDKIQFHFWRMADYDPENPVELLMIKRNFSAETD
ncbi:MAG: hypothetical protein AAF902_17325, partial [Chloroflexota bacterium]